MTTMPSTSKDTCRDHAIANIAAFIDEISVTDPPVSVTMRSPKHDGSGRYDFDLHRGIRTVDVAMPGVPFDEVYCTEGRMPHGCPRLYVDGNSWWWCYAIDTAKDALRDHDGAIERRVKKSEQATDVELDRQPHCTTCGSVRSSVITKAHLYAVRCYTCEPEITTWRETPMGAVYGDDGWKRATHYLVSRQHLPPEVPGHENPMHPDALCGAIFDNDRCRRRRRHDGRCAPYWKEIERTLVTPDHLR